MSRKRRPIPGAMKRYLREMTEYCADLCGLYHDFGPCTCRRREIFAVLNGIESDKANWPERDLEREAG